MYGKGFLGNMTENLQADCVQSRQACFIQCFLNIKVLPKSLSGEWSTLLFWLFFQQKRGPSQSSFQSQQF